MAFVLILFLMMDDQIYDTRTYPMEDRQQCEAAAAQVIYNYGKNGYVVKAMCLRPA